MKSVHNVFQLNREKKKNTISGIKPSEGHLTALGSQVLSMYEKQDTKASGDVQNNE